MGLMSNFVFGVAHPEGDVFEIAEEGHAGGVGVGSREIPFEGWRCLRRSIPSGSVHRPQTGEVGVDGGGSGFREGGRGCGPGSN